MTPEITESKISPIKIPYDIREGLKINLELNKGGKQIFYMIEDISEKPNIFEVIINVLKLTFFFLNLLSAIVRLLIFIQKAIKMKNLKTTIGGIFAAIGTALQASDDGIVRIIGTIIGAIGLIIFGVSAKDANKEDNSN